MGRKKNQDKCEGCIHWKHLYSDGGKSALMACHYFFDTGKTRNSIGAWGECTVKEEQNDRKRISATAEKT